MHLGHSTSSRSTEFKTPKGESSANIARDSSAANVGNIVTNHKIYAITTFDMTANAIYLSLGAYYVIAVIDSEYQKREERVSSSQQLSLQ